jgi:hypothetical protein
MKKLYKGCFDEELFMPPSSPEPTDRVKKLVASYDKLIKDYPPLELEEKGELPAELIRKLGELGIFSLLVPEKYKGAGFKARKLMTCAAYHPDRAAWNLFRVRECHFLVNCMIVRVLDNRDRP